MNKNGLIVVCTVFLFLFTHSVQGQRGWIKRKIQNKVEKDMREKHAEPQREKGKKALEDITYENDTRYPIPENPVQATFEMEMTSFKKNGKTKDINSTKMVFGETGECVIMNEGNKDETRMLFDYKGAATYMINQKEKTATKMPMINFQKMAEKMAQRFDDMEEDEGQWERTGEKKNINGYNSEKYIYINAKEKTKTVIWTTEDINIDLSGNHLFGGQIKDFSTMGNENQRTAGIEDFPRGMMVRMVQYEKNRDTPSTQMDITTFEKSSDPKYFDLDEYEVNDVLDKL